VARKELRKEEVGRLEGYPVLARYFLDGVRSLSERISHFRKLLIRVRFDLAARGGTRFS
jgi:hypothetical protein